MTVKELKEKLQEYDESMTVVDYMGESVDTIKIWIDSKFEEHVQIS